MFWLNVSTVVYSKDYKIGSGRRFISYGLQSQEWSAHLASSRGPGFCCYSFLTGSLESAQGQWPLWLPLTGFADIVAISDHSGQSVMPTVDLVQCYFLIRISTNLDTCGVSTASLRMCVPVLALETQVQGIAYGEFQFDVYRILIQV